MTDPQRENLRREALILAARRPDGLAQFGEFVHAKKAFPLHLCWIDLIQQLWVGSLELKLPGRVPLKYSNLLFDGAPVHGKSNWITTYATEWVIAQNPNINVLMLGKTDETANKFSVDIRRTIENNTEFQAVAPHIMKGTPWNDSQWFVERDVRAGKDATLLAKGVTGSMLGARADWLIADDLVDLDSSRSATQRQHAYDWMSSVAMTRLTPTGKAIYVGNRWHEDDLFAKLAATGEWVVCHTEALRDDGQYALIRYPLPERDDEGRVQWHERRYPLHSGRALWPEVWPEEVLERIRRTNPLRWQTMYVGQPTPQTGGVFRRRDFGYYDELPALGFGVQTWDTAAKTAEQNDYSAMLGGGLGKANGNLYLFDGYEERVAFPALTEEIIKRYELWRGSLPLREVRVEDTSNGTPAFQLIKAKATHVPIVAHKAPTKDKIERANAAYARVTSGGSEIDAEVPPRIYGPRGASWYERFIEEVCAFPYGAHDDWVDALIMLIERLYTEPPRFDPLTLPILGAKRSR